MKIVGGGVGILSELRELQYESMPHLYFRVPIQIGHIHYYS
jgi:hypothetical protein